MLQEVSYTAMKIREFLITLVVAVLLLTGWTYQSRLRWEYRVVFLTNDATVTRELDKLGADGWELVSFDMASKPDRYGQGGLYYFKRPK